MMTPPNSPHLTGYTAGQMYDEELADDASTNGPLTPPPTDDEGSRYAMFSVDHLDEFRLMYKYLQRRGRWG